MGFERVCLFGIIEFDYIAPSGATAVFKTELPGNALATRDTLALPATSARRTVKFRLLGETKGKLYDVVVTSAGCVLLFGGRVFARPLGLAAAWAWYSLPIPPIANTFTEVPLPVPKMGSTFTEVPLPIAKVGAFTEVPLPIPKMSETWAQVKIPMNPTPDLFTWIDVDVAR
jgi:hypothetical protein